MLTAPSTFTRLPKRAQKKIETNLSPSHSAVAVCVVVVVVDRYADASAKASPS